MELLYGYITPHTHTSHTHIRDKCKSMRTIRYYDYTELHYIWFRLIAMHHRFSYQADDPVTAPRQILTHCLLSSAEQIEIESECV